MRDAAGRYVRMALPCGCIYDPNTEDSGGPGSGNILVQGDCQIAAAAYVINQQDPVAREKGSSVFSKHLEFRRSLVEPT